MSATKACRVCGIEQDVETGYRFRRGRRDQKMDTCRACSNAGRKARRTVKLGQAAQRAGQR